MINYYLLTKPGIILGNLITVATGFLLASKGNIDLTLFLTTLIGLGFIIASACIFNNYIDRFTDRKMNRTKTRPLATGVVSVRYAILLAMSLGILGGMILLFYTNLLTVAIATIGFFVYVILYSLWKSRTIYGTAIGSVAGATPPLVGYCAVSNHLDLGALLLFVILVLWQMPHFYSIAFYHLDDYRAAHLPLLPIERGIYKTKVHMVLYIIGFIAVSSLLTLFDYTGSVYLILIGVLGIAWLVLCFYGFKQSDEQQWGCHMFRLSLVIIAAISLAIPLDVVV